jgi:imidazolonepropionase-like amidohydrolase
MRNRGMKKLTIVCSFILINKILAAQIAVKADTIYTITNGKINNGVILIKNGKIEKVGTDVKVPANYKIYEAKFVTPGLVDARSEVGLSGPLNFKADQDQVEKSSPIQPDLRAIDAYNTDDKLVEYLRNNGVTSLHTGHGVGALVSGQTMVVKTKPGLIDSVIIQPLSMLAMSIGAEVEENYTSPGTKGKQMAMLRSELLKAEQYLKKQQDKDSSKRLAKDLNMEMLGDLLRGRVKGLVYANRATDIISAIRLSKEFDFKLVIEGAAEAYRIVDEIKSSGAEVIVHPTMARYAGDMQNVTMENAAILTKAGIPVSIESGFEAYVPKTRVILYEAAAAVGRGGLPYDDALKAITLNPAKLLGLENRIGSIETGKDADVVLYDGDPFEYITRVCTVIIDGQVVADNCK